MTTMPSRTTTRPPLTTWPPTRAGPPRRPGLSANVSGPPRRRIPTCRTFDVTTCAERRRSPCSSTWLLEAVDGGVPQPQAMTVSTSSPSGDVTARTLLLKDVDDAFWFASSALSPKGRQLAENPRVALTFFWRAQGRQVRVRRPDGARAARRRVAPTSLARHPDSRAVAMARAAERARSTDVAGRAASRSPRPRERIDADDDFGARRLDPLPRRAEQSSSSGRPPRAATRCGCGTTATGDG